MVFPKIDKATGKIKVSLPAGYRDLISVRMTFYPPTKDAKEIGRSTAAPAATCATCLLFS